MIKTLRVKVMWAALLAFSFTAVFSLATFTTAHAATDYNWADDNTIVKTVTGGSITFKKVSSNPLEYQADVVKGPPPSKTCPYIIKVSAPMATSGKLYEPTAQYGRDSQVVSCPKNDTNNPTNITISKAAPPDNSSNSDNGNQDDDCPVDPNESFRWASCGLITLGQKAASAMDATIQKFLYTPTDQIFSPQMKTAWNSFRTLGVALILIAGLVMVITQAMGMEVFDAYTVRKVLPRLLIAAIGIALSWPILQFVVTFFNDLGLWANDLILKPFPQNANMSGGMILGVALAVGAAGAKAVLVSMGTSGTLSLLFVVVIAALIGLLVLAIRQLAILVCVLFAPLAIACYILPGTQKIWQFWKNTLMTSLAMFPIIMAFIAAGKAFAWLASSTDSTEMHLLAVLVYFAPYFLLPFAFKLAGGLMATVFSMANDKSRGVFDKQRKKRELIREDRHKRAASNSLWDPNSRITKALRGNSIASWSTDPGGNFAYKNRNLKYSPFRKAGLKVAGQIEHARVEQSGKLFEELNKMGYNDKAYRALSGVHDDLSDSTKAKLAEKGLLNKAPQNLRDMDEMARILSESDNDTEIIGGNAIAASRGRLASMYQDPEMMKADIGAAGIMGLSAHGFATSADLAKAGNLLSHGEKEEAGYAQAVVSQAQLMGMRSRPDIKPGYGVLYDGATGEFKDGMKERDVDVIQTLSAHDIAGAKGGAFTTLAPTYKQILKPSEETKALAAQYTSMTKEQQVALKNTDTARYKSLSRADKIVRSRQAAEDQLLQWAGPYTQASVDIKNQALQMIDDLSEKDEKGNYVKGTIGEKYQLSMRTGRSVEEIEALRQAGINPEENQPGGPGAGGQQ